MTNSTATATATAELIAPLRPSLVRNAGRIIVDTFGDVSVSHQCVTIALTAHKKDSEGFTEEEAAHVTIPLLGCARVILEAWLAVVLPGWELHDWAVFCPCEDSADEPF